MATLRGAIANLFPLRPDCFPHPLLIRSGAERGAKPHLTNENTITITIVCALPFAWSRFISQPSRIPLLPWRDHAGIHTILIGIVYCFGIRAFALSRIGQLYFSINRHDSTRRYRNLSLACCPVHLFSCHHRGGFLSPLIQHQHHNTTT